MDISAKKLLAEFPIFIMMARLDKSECYQKVLI